jgi:hypothetical protein
VTRPLVVLAATATVGALLLVVSAFAPTASHGCPNTGDPVGRPIVDPAERALIVDTFSPATIDECWPGTPLTVK